MLDPPIWTVIIGVGAGVAGVAGGGSLPHAVTLSIDEQGTSYEHWRFHDLGAGSGPTAPSIASSATVRRIDAETDYARMGRGRDTAVMRRDRLSRPGYGQGYIHPGGSEFDYVLIGDRYRQPVQLDPTQPPAPLWPTPRMARDTTTPNRDGIPAEQQAHPCSASSTPPSPPPVLPSPTSPAATAAPPMAPSPPAPRSGSTTSSPAASHRPTPDRSHNSSRSSPPSSPSPSPSTPQDASTARNSTAASPPTSRPRGPARPGIPRARHPRGFPRATQRPRRDLLRRRLRRDPVQRTGRRAPDPGSSQRSRSPASLT